MLLGYSNDLLRHHMELRGIGIIDIKDLFGVASTRDVKPIDLVVRLEKWVEGTEYDRLGIAGETFELLGVSKPYVRLPVASGAQPGAAGRDRSPQSPDEASGIRFRARIHAAHRRADRAAGDRGIRLAAGHEPGRGRQLRAAQLHTRTRFNPDVLDRTRRQR